MEIYEKIRDIFVLHLKVIQVWRFITCHQPKLGLKIISIKNYMFIKNKDKMRKFFIQIIKLLHIDLIELLYYIITKL